MAGTGALDDLVVLAVSQQWRLVLIGDPRQLQAVGRGGMFDELCRTGRARELVTVHRFHHRWEQAACLQLRARDADGLDAYIGHGRVTAGTSTNSSPKPPADGSTTALPVAASPSSPRPTNT